MKPNTMRRSNQGYVPLPQSSNSVEEQNDELADQLKDKIGVLKSLSITIRDEVKEHNNFLSGLDDDFERTGGFLGRTMNRVIQLGKGSHNHYILYLFLFSILVFFIIWILIR